MGAPPPIFGIYSVLSVEYMGKEEVVKEGCRGGGNVFGAMARWSPL
jgi:hypothetical protein